MGSEAPERDHVDIGCLMVNYRLVIDKFYILKLLVEAISKIRRWENYPLSLAVVSIICVSVLVPRVLLLLGVVCLVFIIMAGNKTLTKSKHWKPYSSLSPLHSKLVNEDKEHLKAAASVQATRQQQLEDFRKLLKASNDILMYVNSVQDQIINLLTWKNERNTLSLLLFLLVWIVAAMWITIPMVLSVILVLFFCWNDHFTTQSSKFWLNRKKQVNHISQERIHDDGHVPPVHISQDTREEEMSTSCERTGQELQNSCSTSETDNDVCHKCKVAFTILKRKHSCSNCGYLYCGSCSVKVPRAKLGATSPAAFKEFVRVCYDCKAHLDTQNNTN